MCHVHVTQNLVTLPLATISLEGFITNYITTSVRHNSHPRRDFIGNYITALVCNNYGFQGDF